MKTEAAIQILSGDITTLRNAASETLPDGGRHGVFMSTLSISFTGIKPKSPTSRAF